MIQMICDLQNQVIQLWQESAEIKERVMYMPNGLGYQMAQ